MKPITDKKRQWLWFAGLWVGGLTCTTLLAFGARLMIRLI